MLVAVLALLLGPVAAVGPLAPLAPLPARAAAPAEEALVRVLLDGVGPAVPRPAAPVFFSGRVVEADVVTALRLVVGRPVQDREGLAAADRRPQYQRRLPPVAVEAPPVPDGTVAFQLTTSPEELELADAGVYPVGVEALVGDVVFARTDTFLPWFPDGTPPPVGLDLLLPLTAEPLLSPGGSLTDEAAARAGRLLGPQGRLGRLVAAAAAGPTPAPVTWAVDADVLRTAEVASRRSDDVAPAASAWLASVRQSAAALAASGRPPVALPYADADVPALLRSSGGPGADEALATGVSQTEQLLGVAPAPGVAWPAEGVGTVAGVRALADAGVQTLVSGSLARTSTSGLAGTQVRVVAPDPGLSDLVTPTSADRRRGSAVAYQRLLAETALVAADGGREEPVVVTLPRDWDPSSEEAAAVLRLPQAVPWLRPASAVTAAADGPGPARPRGPSRDSRDGSPLPSDADRAADPLSAAWTRSAGRLDAALARLTALVLADDQGVLDPERRSVLRTVSAAWRLPTARERGERLLAATADHLGGLLGEVRLTGTDAVTLTSDAGDLPVTVTNGLAARVEVGVLVDAGGQARLAVAASPRLVLAPRSSQTVPVPVRAGASGRFRVEVQLTTVGGEPVGPAQEVLVRVTALGRLALAITVGAVAVLLLASGARLLRRAARSRRSLPHIT